MQAQVLLSIISDDKPGIVESLAELIAQNGGNWLESSLSQLAGKFAGIIKVSVAQEHLAALEQGLKSLEAKGIRILLEATHASDSPSTEQRQKAAIQAIGPDRAGIVKELAQALATYGINVESFNTQCTSMPYSGDPIFEAQGVLSIPANTKIDALLDDMDRIADSLAMDISINLEEE